MVTCDYAIVELLADGNAVLIAWCAGEEDAKMKASDFTDKHPCGTKKIMPARLVKRIDWNTGSKIGTWKKTA